jgi:hypothetical protein
MQLQEALDFRREHELGTGGGGAHLQFHTDHEVGVNAMAGRPGYQVGAPAGGIHTGDHGGQLPPGFFESQQLQPSFTPIQQSAFGGAPDRKNELPPDWHQRTDRIGDLPPDWHQKTRECNTELNQSTEIMLENLYVLHLIMKLPLTMLRSYNPQHSSQECMLDLLQE